MSLFAVFTPILNAILFSVSGRKTRPYAYFLAFTAMFSLLALLLVALPEMVRGDVASTSIGSWIYSGLFEVDWAFGVDPLTFVMLFVVLTVSSLVHLYSTAYMGEDPHIPRFMSYLSLFTFFMLLLVSSENFISLFLGWEGVGLCSYLLISFWFTRTAANKAAIKAMIVNRVADLALTIGIIAAFFIFQTVEFGPIFGLAPFVTNLSPVTLLLFIGAMGKSAQIGLHTWLPDAMEGPTPVSALIHAATMVTAGVFLVIRCSALFEQTPDVLLFITFIGAATAFMAATSGLMQNDLKKIIAYSTCSQLGYMVFICGLSGYAISFFHLTNHAFFKALLFLSAGAVIHAVSNEQDLRRLGGLIQLLPYTYIMFVIGSLALMGFPFLTGFYSKDLILEVVAGQLTVPASFAYWLGLVTALFTAFYSFRLLYLAFYSRSRSSRVYLVHAHELTPNLALPLALLALGSIFFGFFARDLFIGFGTMFWNGVVPASPVSQAAGEFLSAGVKLIPLAGSTAAVLAVFFVTATYHNAFNRMTYRFLSHKWYFDTVYNRLINQPLLQAAYYAVFKPIDKGVLELAGPTGFGALTIRVAYRTTTAQTGRVYDYAWFMFFLLLYFFAGAEVACLGAYVRIGPWTFRLLSITPLTYYVYWGLHGLAVLKPIMHHPSRTTHLTDIIWDMAIVIFAGTVFMWLLYLIVPSLTREAAHAVDKVANMLIGPVVGFMEVLLIVLLAVPSILREIPGALKRAPAVLRKLPRAVMEVLSEVYRFIKPPRNPHEPPSCQPLGYFILSCVLAAPFILIIMACGFEALHAALRNSFDSVGTQTIYFDVWQCWRAMPLWVRFGTVPFVIFICTLAWWSYSYATLKLAFITSIVLVVHLPVRLFVAVCRRRKECWDFENLKVFNEAKEALSQTWKQVYQAEQKGLSTESISHQYFSAYRDINGPLPKSWPPSEPTELYPVSEFWEIFLQDFLVGWSLVMFATILALYLARSFWEASRRWIVTALCFCTLIFLAYKFLSYASEFATMRDFVGQRAEWVARIVAALAKLREVSAGLPPYDPTYTPPKPKEPWFKWPKWLKWPKWPKWPSFGELVRLANDPKTFENWHRLGPTRNDR